MEREIIIIKEGSNEKDLMLLSENNNENSIDLEKEKTGGTSDYGALFNKPKINGVELNENKTLEDLGIQPKGDYLTEHQEISHLATKTELTNGLNEKANSSHTHSEYLTSIPSEYVTQSDLDAKGYATKEDLKDIDVDLTDYYTKTEIDNKGFLTQKDIENFDVNIELLNTITYADLKTLRNNSELVAGMLYRIIDYVTTSIQDATQSAGHQFDIIVKALDENTLDEEVKVIQSENDEYFANSNLTGWQVWYTLDNDTSKYAWADEANGKGVIYRLIDENGNDLPYDFKNIQMLDANNSEDTIYYYTFDNKGTDLSLNGSLCFNNVINKYISGTQRVNRIIFKCGNTEVSTNFFDFECYNNTLGTSTDHLKFGRECYGNVFGGMNHLCTFDTKFRNNTVGSETQSIQVGQGASNNMYILQLYYF